MDPFEPAFRLLPDTAIITDVYWYVLDFNRAFPFDGMRKGLNLSRFMPDCKSLPRDTYSCGGRIFQRSVSPVRENGMHVGYAVYLADVTEREALIEQSRRKSEELEKLTREQARANAELEECARQAQALTGYEEQARIARSIHDDAGHAITELNTLSQMCLQLRETDPVQYGKLIDEGIAICRRAMANRPDRQRASLRETLEAFRDASPFPIELTFAGEESPFAAALSGVILSVCKEAYHNTLSHSMADRLAIEVRLSGGTVTVRIADNGRFRGKLEKGFGLTSMEENVRATGGRVSFEAEEGKGFGVLAEWRDAQ